DYANAYYNKAACYALQPQLELALENLQQAINLNPRYRQQAETDIDFELIAKDKRFRQLIVDNKGRWQMADGRRNPVSKSEI
ncbi:tetratricopeptide repeat protein, partial [Fischerella thermalis]